jgi:hypothetical protein
MDEILDLVKPGQHRQLKEIDLSGKSDCFQIRTNHYFGISVISLSSEDALQLRDEIDGWVGEQAKLRSEPVLTE